MLLQHENKAIPVDQSVTESTPQPKFIFTAKGRSLSATGVKCVISNQGLNQQAFIDSVKDQLSALEAAGMDNPMVIGAIPFDKKQTTELFVPQYYQFAEQLPTMKQHSATMPQFKLLKQVTNQQHYANAVTKALSLFEQTQLNKVVLSRAIDVESNNLLDPQQLAATLYQQNPDAYVFALPQSNGTTLIGASPELLIKKHDNQVFSNPLAGSRKRQYQAEQDQQITEELFHCDKDRYEHKLVADAVAQGLQPFCDDMNIPEAPSIIHTPTMWHLSSKINGTLNTPTSALELAYQLHPTPAVCGTPYALAKATIKHLEGYDRQQFCGAVGWMDAKGNGEWVVTIRCGVMLKKSIRLYAGAGIVAGSLPEHEYQETEAKLNTMLNAFGFAQNA